MISIYLDRKPHSYHTFIKAGFFLPKMYLIKHYTNYISKFEEV